MTVVGFVLYGSLVLLPLWLQTLLGYPSLQAGIALAPRGLGSCLECRSSARWSANSTRGGSLRRVWRLGLSRCSNSPAESSGRILGFLLASISAGLRVVYAVCSANDDYDEPDLPRGDGKREPVSSI